MKKIFFIFIYFIIFSLPVGAYQYAYNLKSERVYTAPENAELSFYGKKLIIAKNEKGYFLPKYPSKYYPRLMFHPLTEDFAFVFDSSSFYEANVTYINYKGKIVIPFGERYESLGYVFTQDGRILVTDSEDGHCYSFNIEGKKKTISCDIYESEYYQYEERKNNLSQILNKYKVFEQDGLWGISDSSGNVIVKPTFKHPIKVFCSGYFLADE